MTKRGRLVLALAFGALGCGGAAATLVITRSEARNAPASACVKDIALGADATCILFENGSVHCHGDFKVLGNGNRDAEPDRDPVRTAARFSAIAVGYNEACGVTRGPGEVWCWGEHPGDEHHQGSELLPVSVPELGTKNVAVTVGVYHVCAMTDAGAVSCRRWGRAATVRVIEAGAREIVGSEFPCAKMASGEVRCWGNDLALLPGWTDPENGYGKMYGSAPAPVAGGPAFRGLRGSDSAHCALDGAGEVWCWGTANDAAFADGRYVTDSNPKLDVIEETPTKLALPFAVRDFPVGFATAAIAQDGSVWAWGRADFGEILGAGSVNLTRDGARLSLEPRPKRLDALGTDNARIYSGSSHFCVRKTDGSIWCWGDNRNRQVSWSNRANTVGLTELPVTCPPG